MCCPGVNGCANYSCVDPVTVCIGLDGVQYQVGESYPQGDGCNNWYESLKRVTTAGRNGGWHHSKMEQEFLKNNNILLYFFFGGCCCLGGGGEGIGVDPSFKL